MHKQEIQFAVVTKGNKVTAVGRSQVLQPEVKFRGGGYQVAGRYTQNKERRYEK